MSNRPPRIALFATRWLGAEVLTRLHARGHDLALVTTQAEDRTALAARARAIPVVAKPDQVPLIPADLPWRPDLILCAHAFRILPDWLLQWSRLGGIGYHPSLLPAYRGRHAVAEAITAGQRFTGGTVYWLTRSIDAGPTVILHSNPLQTRVQILPNETAPELWRRALAPLGADLLLQAVDGILG